MAKETGRKNIIGAQTVQPTVADQPTFNRYTTAVKNKPSNFFYDLNVSSCGFWRLSIDTVCWLSSKPQTSIYNYFYSRGFSDFSPFSILWDSSNVPQEWSNFSLESR